MFYIFTEENVSEKREIKEQTKGEGEVLSKNIKRIKRKRLKSLE
jgi:hypothetical protein